MGSLRSRLQRLEDAGGKPATVEETWYERLSRLSVGRGGPALDPPENEPPPIFGEGYVERIHRLRRQRAERERGGVDADDPSAA